MATRAKKAELKNKTAFFRRQGKGGKT